MSDLHLRNASIHRLVRHAARGALAAGGLAATLLSSPGHASAEMEAFGDFGVFAGYTWGDGGGFTWGIEGRVGALGGESSNFSCGGGALVASAAVARLSFVDLDQLRLGGSAQAGVFMGPTAAMFDIGLGYRWGENGGVSVPIGFDLQVWGIDGMLSFDAMLGGGFVGGGLRYPPLDREVACVVEGRPLHDERGRSTLPALRPLSQIRPRSELDTAVMHEWAGRARAEWASVPAFVQLADQLRHAHAPHSLVTRARRAALDEVRHAVLTTGIASRAARAPMSLDRVSAATRAPARGRAALVRLAVESWLDGCLGEGFAAAKAARESRHATDDGMRATHDMIAIDEAAHAELAWDVLDWSIRSGGDDVRHALWAIRDAVQADSSDPLLDGGSRAHGLLPAAENGRIAESASLQAQSRLRALLAS